MDKIAIRNFAINAKKKLEADVKREAKKIGITEKGISEPKIKENDYMLFENDEGIKKELYKKEIKQREKLVSILKEKEKKKDFKEAFNSVIEEIAYTWFNRIITIRFMEVNDYIPDGIRVLSSERENDNEPQIIREPFNTDIEFSIEEKEEIYKLKEENKTEELFRLLFIKKCNKLNEILPELFEKIEDYSELLLTISINDEEGIVYKLINEIGEENFKIKEENSKNQDCGLSLEENSIAQEEIEGQVEVIGWLYQYYNEEKKKEVVGMNKGIIAKEDIPVATQIFTTDWVVKYMVENSLGKYWIERNPNSKLKDSLKYFVTPKNGEIVHINEKIRPEEIKFLEPCMGIGHILVYAFEILMEIYREEGYSDKDAVRSILENNLYGLDIDKRAYQLSYFAVMMKAREYDRRIFSREIELNLAYTKESFLLIDNESIEKLKNSKKINIEELKTSFFVNGITTDEKQNEIGEYLIRVFEDAEEQGSLIKVEKFDYDAFDKYLDECRDRCEGSILGLIWIENIYTVMKEIVKSAKILNNKYHVVCTNPPYLNKYNPKLKNFIETNYKEYKGDLFSVFMKRVFDFLVEDGYSGWMTSLVWMFIKTYEELRKYIVLNKSIFTLIQMEYSAFEEAVVPICSFVLKNGEEKEKGIYFRLTEFKGGMEVQRKKVLEAIANPNCGYFYETSENNFEKIPGMPIAYWASDKIYEIFENNDTIGSVFDVKKGSDTGNNAKYLRMFYEINYSHLGLYLENGIDTVNNNKTWVPYDKGGEFRRWYGNNAIVIYWENDGAELKQTNANLRSKHLYFRNHITWNALTSSNTSARYSNYGALFDSAGSSMFPSENNINFYLAYMNSKVVDKMLLILNPTLNYGAGTISKLPNIDDEVNKQKINFLTKENISTSKLDWDMHETSWDFKGSPLLANRTDRLIASAYESYKTQVNERFVKLKENEEELNRIFIEIYGLQEEMTGDVSDRNITIAKIFDETSEIDEEIKGNSYVLTKADVVKQLISYAVGCMFGRYSLDEEGLVFAGGEFNREKYISYIPDMDNCIPITDSEYFSDDIVTKFVEFIKVVYGNDTLGENLEFIADSLGNKGGTPKEVIRNYFLKDFYNDHIKRYRKRPIYWLYDSGKKDGFKALVYMHRYDEQTTAKVRISYLHELQKYYERRADFLKDEIENNSNRKMAEQELKKIKSQLDECKQFDEKMNHLSSEYISIDLDDGVKVNYIKVQTDRNGKIHEVLGKD